MYKVILADNLRVLKSIKDNSIPFIYIDPPFNTGKSQISHDMSFKDKIVDYYEFMQVRLEEAYRILSPNGCMYLHIDYRECHYLKIMMDKIFGRDNFINEIIWAYDYGGRPKTRWPAKHDNILYYVKDKNNYVFNFEEMDRIPYMAPGLVGEKKAAIGKTPTDVFWHTIVPTNGYERTGYPTQKPLGIINRLVRVSSNPGDICLDFFAGSGTLGESAYTLGRNFLLIDDSHFAVNIIMERLGDIPGIEFLL